MFIVVFLLATISDDQLIAQLGDDDWAKREIATEKLKERMDFTMYLRLREERFSDPEVNIRIQSVLDDFEERTIFSYKLNFHGAKMYPLIDHVLDNYRCSLPWCWWWDSSDFVQHYLDYADALGAPHDGAPKWTNYRLATELLIRDRICWVAYPAIKEAKTEKEFQDAMKKIMEPIQKDFDRFIEREVMFYSISKKQLNYFFGRPDGPDDDF